MKIKFNKFMNESDEKQKNLENDETLPSNLYADYPISEDEKTYTESEVLRLLELLASEIIYGYDDYGRGQEFADNQGEKEAGEFFENNKK